MIQKVTENVAGDWVMGLGCMLLLLYEYTHEGFLPWMTCWMTWSPKMGPLQWK